ncbi:MAG: Type 1 glutamine amidotransferase-like domain-containing protein, partial [Candidatus Berkelbacteria bacterium]|nr:Type 1 glutamine amidotransferase-like domain-containing protein [Candidatus Berkelbacteria bacterium]
MKIFLTSQAQKVMGKIAAMLPKPTKKLKLAFIPTAGDPYGDNKPWMDADRDKLVELEFQVEDFDLKNKTEDETRQTLSKFDIIFVAGGNTFYLLNEIKKSGFDKVARELVRKGRVYIGSSAGSYIACPTIEAACWKHADKNIVNLKDLTALNLVDFIVVCHYLSQYKEIVEAGKKTTKFPVITLTDNQFIFADDNNF